MNDRHPREATNAGTEPGLQPISNGKHFRETVGQMTRPQPRTYQLAALLGLAMALLALESRADIPLAEEEACDKNHKAGDPCTYVDEQSHKRTQGTCRDSTCPWRPDEPMPPCFKCVPRQQPKPKQTPDDCSVATSPVATDATARRIAPWLMAGTFSLLFLLRRRRP